MWDEITVQVKYGCDYRLARELFERTLSHTTGDYTQQAKSSWANLIQQYRVEPAELDPRVFLAANDNWMEFTLRYVVDYKKRRVTKDLLFTRILGEVESTNRRVALASATFHLVDAPELKVSSLTRQKAARLECRLRRPGESTPPGLPVPHHRTSSQADSMVVGWPSI